MRIWPVVVLAAFAPLGLLTPSVGNAQGATGNAVAFAGAGNPLQAPGGSTPLLIPPAITVAPSSLSFTVAANAVEWKPLNIANAAGSDWLIVHLETQANDAAATIPGTSVASTVSSVRKISQLQPVVSPAAIAGPASPRSVWALNGSIPFALDDGTVEAAYGLGTPPPPIPHEVAAVFINRFSASEALTIDSVSIYWPGQALAQGDLTGLQANPVAYYDADADGDPTNAVRLGGDDIVAISETDAFQTYPTSFIVPGAGDVYIGFVDQWAVNPLPPPPGRKYPAAIDTTNPQQHSYVSIPASGATVDWNNLANNDQTGTIDSISGNNPAGNLMVRATASPGGGGGGPSCSGSAVGWLTLSPAAMQIYQGVADYDVVVRANPSAASLTPGDYSAQVCITTNDPENPVVSVAVALTVTEVPCQAQDEIFCGSFDPRAGTGQPGIYQTRDEFLTHVSSGYYENSFDGVPNDDAPSPAIHFVDAVSGFAYTVDTIAHNDQLWNKNGHLSTNYSADQFLVTFTGTPVTAVGGNFYANDGFVGNPVVGNATVITLSDGTVETFVTQSADDFRGFTSSVPITSIAIDAPNPGNLFDQSWATLDNLIVGSAN